MLSNQQRQQLAGELKQRLQRLPQSASPLHSAQLNTSALSILESVVNESRGSLIANAEELTDIVEDCIGFGCIARLLNDPTITEVMVNDYRSIFIERDGRLEKSLVSFAQESDLLRVIDRIVIPLGRRLDSSQPMVDARLPDGSRVNAVLAPLAIRGACLTIRKFSPSLLTLSDLIKQGALSKSAADYLQAAISQRKNMLISGGTGSGKTTLLNILSAEIPSEQRIVSIEDAAELKLPHDNLVALEARPNNSEGVGSISIRELLMNALRMRPDRIIIGECRGAEALDMLQAMNTGHDGSLTTLHANSPRDALQRLEVMVLMAGLDLPLAAIRQQMSSAVDVVIQIARSGGGARQVTAITELSGLEGQQFQLTPIFHRIDKDLVTTGIGSEWYRSCP
ncbi:pilus assembly protein CpaF [Pseudidiomarina aestuarii]|uniref:Pilus assembly protein CpaF n=1 Tax=Pseudidiomarina aestuarii TaxID=624146 RepID=A0A7Z7ESI2_9GAMM|nr:CpaF family protein [Pseudidiomarina aestuarii]RUO37922.1 pilus assembly protein CpaF [Pseudidiomarina aestuarii]